MNKIIKLAEKWLKEYEERESWTSDYSGSHITEAEKEAAKILRMLLNK